MKHLIQETVLNIQYVYIVFLVLFIQLKLGKILLNKSYGAGPCSTWKMTIAREGRVFFAGV